MRFTSADASTEEIGEIFILIKGLSRMKNIILIGMPAVGKSTVGVVVAKRLGYDFVDTDLLIQKQEGKLLKEIIGEEGIERFLEIENQVNKDLWVERAVISPGGSVVYCKEAMEHFKKIGEIVYLRASFDTIEKRIPSPQQRGVVLKGQQNLRDLYDERVPLFEQYADYIVDQDGMELGDTIERVLALFAE